jgi:hypothetical protein
MTYSRNHTSSILRRSDPDPQPCLPWGQNASPAGAVQAVDPGIPPAETPPERPVDLPGRTVQDHTSSTVARPAVPPPPAAPRTPGRSAASSCAGRVTVCTRRRFAAFEVATVALRVMRLNGRSYSDALKPIRCTRCGGWHLVKERHRG